MFKKRVSNQVLSNFPKYSPSGKLTFDKCGKKQRGECMMGTGNFLGCVKDGHKDRDCPNMRIQDKGNIKDQSSGPILDGPKRNYYYPVRYRGEQEEFPNVDTGLLQVFSIDVYDLLYPGAT